MGVRRARQQRQQRVRRLTRGSMAPRIPSKACAPNRRLRNGAKTGWLIRHLTAVVLNAADMSSMPPAVLGALGRLSCRRGEMSSCPGETNLPAAWHPSRTESLTIGGGIRSRLRATASSFTSENPCEAGPGFHPELCAKWCVTARATGRSLPSDSGGANSGPASRGQSENSHARHRHHHARVHHRHRAGQHHLSEPPQTPHLDALDHSGDFPGHDADCFCLQSAARRHHARHAHRRVDGD